MNSQLPRGLPNRPPPNALQKANKAEIGLFADQMAADQSC